jgi:hypothetical protein
LRSTADVRQLAQAGGAQLLHVAAHGRFDPQNANLSPLSLQDGALTPFDLTGERAAGLRRERAIVFLNVCHTGRLAFSLTGLGGWAERFINDLNVSAFIGTLWEVNDLLAAEFAIAFYDRLLAGESLGQAFYAARLHIRDRQPGNPTWLAYVLYGDPNSFVLWGLGDDEGEPREKAVEQAPVPIEPPKPTVDPDELKVSLASYLAATLPDLVRRSLNGLIDEAVTRALSPETSAEATEESDTAQAVKVAEQLDSNLLLSALASSQIEADPTVSPTPTPNGVHPPDEPTSSTPSPSVEGPQGEGPGAQARSDEGREARRPRRPRKSDEGETRQSS